MILFAAMVAGGLAMLWTGDDDWGTAATVAFLVWLWFMTYTSKHNSAGGP